jgi:hypothetical protein
LSGFRVGDYRTHAEFKTVPQGTHLGLVIGVAFLGLQPGSKMYPNPAYKIALTVAFPGQKNDDGTDMEVTSQYTMSMSKKATLRKVAEAISGPLNDQQAKDFDPSTLVGKAALFSVTHTQKEDRTYANLGGVIALPGGMPVPTTPNRLRVFHPNVPDFLSAYNALPEFLRKKWDERLPEENKAGPADDVAI